MDHKIIKVIKIRLKINFAEKNDRNAFNLCLLAFLCAKSLKFAEL